MRFYIEPTLSWLSTKESTRAYLGIFAPKSWTIEQDKAILAVQDESRFVLNLQRFEFKPLLRFTVMQRNDPLFDSMDELGEIKVLQTDYKKLHLSESR